MIQIRQIRVSPRGDSVEKPLDKNILVGSLADLFSQIDTLISKIPEKDRVNLFYTRGSTPGDFTRKFSSQSVIPFDIDGIREIDGKIDHSFEPDIEKIVSTVFDALECDRDKCVVVSSGNGIQILVQPEREITSEKFFTDYEKQYLFICREIDRLLEERGLSGKADLSVFSPNGVFRLPGTINRKPGLPERTVTLLNGRLLPQPFKITPPPTGVENSEPWQTAKGEALPLRSAGRISIDQDAVEEGCNFLKAAKASPNDLSEAQWYAMLSIVGRFPDPEKVHEYSKGHSGYSRRETETKKEQALAASGPRTCDGINKIWGQCESCENYKRVVSPISLHEKTFIRTINSGFHEVTKSGSLSPVPSDMRLFFEREHPYKVSPESASVFVFDGKTYERWSDTQLRAFAEKHFSPAVGERTILEFKHAVTRTNLFERGFFENSTRGFVNFQNGVYSIKDQTLYPHSEEYGFLYVLPFDFVPNAICPNFDSFLAGFTVGDSELEDVLKEFLGYAICDDDYAFQKCLVLLGEGANGKSTFLKIVQLLMGEKNISHLALEDLSSTTAKSALEGKLINLCDELPTQRFENTNSFKNLFGGTTSVRKLYKDAQTIRNMAKFIFSGNTMPISQDTTDGFLRRLIFVPAKARFEDGKNADPKIVHKMEHELPGIFNACVVAFQNAKARGSLKESSAGAAVHQSYRKSIDTVRAWWEDFGEVHDDFEAYTKVSDLFLSYQLYQTSNNDRSVSKDMFLKKLSPRIPGFDSRYERAQINGERTYVLKGVRLNLDKEHEPVC